MEHHLINFPPHKFYGKPGTVKKVYGHEVPTLWQLMDPRTSTNFTWKHEGPLYAMNVVILAGAYYYGFSVLTLCFVLLLGVVMGTVGSALHSSFHVPNFHLEKYKWYMELRTLHYLHHLGSMKHNYAVLNLGLDGFFRSLVVDDPRKSRSNTEIKVGNLPHGISKDDVEVALSNAGANASLLLFDVPLSRKAKTHNSALQRGYPTVFLRILVVVLGITVWYRMVPIVVDVEAFDGSLFVANDWGHTLTAEWRAAVLQSPELIPLLCTMSVLIREIMIIIAITYCLLGPTVRVALSGTFAIIARAGMLAFP